MAAAESTDVHRIELVIGLEASQPFHLAAQQLVFAVLRDVSNFGEDKLAKFEETWSGAVNGSTKVVVTERVVKERR